MLIEDRVLHEAIDDLLEDKTPKQKRLLREWVPVAGEAYSNEKNGDDYEYESVGIDPNDDWKAFSRARGYTEEEIAQFERYLELSHQVMASGVEEDELASFTHATSQYWQQFHPEEP